MRKTTALPRAGRTLPDLAAAAAVGSGVGARVARPVAGKRSDVPPGMIRSKATGLLYEKPNSPAGWSHLETIDRGVEEVRAARKRRESAANSPTPAFQYPTTQERGEVSGLAAGAGVYRKMRQDQQDAANPQIARKREIENEARKASASAVTVPKLAYGQQGAGKPGPVYGPSGKHVFQWNGTPEGRQRILEADSRAAGAGKSGKLLLSKDYPDVYKTARATEPGGNAEVIGLGSVPLGRAITEAGNQVYDLATDLGVKGGKALGGKTGGFIAGQVAGLAGGLAQVPTNVVGGAIQMVDPGSTPEQALLGGAEAAFEVGGGHLIGELYKRVGKKAVDAAVAKGKPALKALYTRTFRASEVAAEQAAERMMREAELAAVRRSVETQAAAPSQVVPGVAAMAGKRRTAKASASPTYFDTLTPQERSQVYSAGVNKLQGWIDQVDEADGLRVPVDPKAAAVARLAREELGRRQASAPARITTNDSALDDFTATFEQFAGLDTTPKDADRLIAAMRSLGMPEEKVTAAAASLNPVLEYGRRQGLPIGDILVRAADDLDPSGKLRQEWAAPFYSKLEQTVLSKVPNRASGVQIKNTLIAAGVKPEELQYTGVGRMLDEAGVNPVSKDDIIAHLQDGQVRVEVVEKGGDRAALEAARKAADDAYVKAYQARAEFEDTWTGGDTEEFRRTLEFLRGRETDASRRLGEAEQRVTRGGSKFSQYTLAGGEPGSYREMLITLPSSNKGRFKIAQREGGDWAIIDTETGKTHSIAHRRDMLTDSLDELNRNAGAVAYEAHPAPNGDGWGVFRDGEMVYGPALLERDAYEMARERTMASLADTRRDFTQSHWDEPNVLAHVRFDTRVGPNGEKILHVAEVQSDWHQKGRKQGYEKKTLELPPGMVARRLVAEDVETYDIDPQQVGGWGIFDVNEGATPDLIAQGPAGQTRDEFFADLAEEAPDGLFEGRISGVPDAPFKKTWHELAMKRVMRYAAENDFDAITWDVGATQADRYSLSKQVDSIEAIPRDLAGEQFMITATKGGERVLSRVVPASELPDMLGQELADRIINRTGGIPVNGYRVVKETSGGTYAVQGGSRMNDVRARGSTREHAQSIADELNDRVAEEDGGRVYSGLDLEFGGEGMKGFYDKILPDFVNKYTKKWGGSASKGEIGKTDSKARDYLFGLAEGKSTIPRPESWTPSTRDLEQGRDYGIDLNAADGMALGTREEMLDELWDMKVSDVVSRMVGEGSNQKNIKQMFADARRFGDDPIVLGNVDNALSAHIYDGSLSVRLKNMTYGEFPDGEFNPPYVGMGQMDADAWTGELRDAASALYMQLDSRPGSSMQDAIPIVISEHPELELPLRHISDYFFENYPEAMNARWMDATRLLGEPGKPAWRVDVTPQMKAAVLNDGQPLFQTGESGIKALYDPVSRVMELGSGRADLSSVIHETGHFFHQSLLADPEFADVIRRHYGEITNVKGTEQFARHFERYLSSGKAPIAELQNVFEALRQWMRQIYERFGFGKAPKEVREIFERVYSEPSAETRRLVERLDELSVNRDVRDPSAGSFERHMGMDDAGDFIDSVDPADDALADALEYRAARGRLMERARGVDTNDLSKLDIDDPRLDDLNDAYDEKLTQALYLKAGGKIEDFDYVNPRDLIGPYLEKQREREGLEFVDIEQLEEWLGYMTQRDTKNKSAASTTEAQLALIGSGQMRRGFIPDDAWRRAFRDKNGNWRVLGKPVQMAGIPEDFPRPLANILLEAAQTSSGVKYIRQGDYRNSRVHGTKPKVWDSAELVTRQGFMDDMQRGEGVHVDTNFPVSVWNAVIDDLRAQIAYQRDLERIADPLSVRREVAAALPDDATSLPRGSETSARQTDVQIDRIRYGLDVIEEGDTRGWSELLDKGDPDRATALVEKKAVWSDQDNADAVLALARLKTRHEELLRAGMGATGEALDDAARQLRWVEKEMDTLTEAMYRSGSEQGRALASRKLTLDSNWDQVNLRVRAKMAAAEIGRDVDKGTKKYLEQVAKEIKDVEALLETARAGRAIKGMSRGKRRSLSVIEVDILRAKEEFKKAREKARAGAFSTIVPPALTDADVYKTLTALVKYEIEAGVVQLENLVSKMIGHAKDLGVVNPTDSDIRRMLAGYDKPDAPQTPAEARALLIDLKREAQLIETINAMKAGVELPKGRARARAGGAPNVEALELELAKLQAARKESARATAEMRRLSEKTGREAARAFGEVDPSVATAKASKEAERATRAQMLAGETRQQKIDRLLAEAEARRAGTFVEPDKKVSTRQPDPEMDALKEEVRQLRLDDKYRQKLTDDIARLEGELASGEFTKRGKAQRQLSEEVARLKDRRDMLRREADQRILALRYPPTVFDRFDSLGRNMSLANVVARVVDLASNVNRAKGGAVEGLLRTGFQKAMGSLMSEEAKLAAERIKTPADLSRIFSGWRSRVKGKAATQARGGDAKYGRGGFITNLTGLTDVPFRDYYERSFLSDVANNAAEKGLGDVDVIFNKLVAGDSVPGFNADNIREAARSFADRMTFNAENAFYSFVSGADQTATRKIRGMENKSGKLAMSALQNLVLRPMFRFSKVIGNVALDRLDRTPVGMVKAIASLALDGRKGALSATQAREISELAAKSLPGTALFAGGYYMAKNALGPESDENSLARRFNESAVAPKVKKTEGGSVYVDWGQLGQLGGDMSSFQLGYGLALIEGLGVKEEGEKDPEKITARQQQVAYYRLFTDIALDQPAISGPQRYLRAKDDPGSFSKFAGSFLSSFVIPGQLRQMAVDKDAIDEQLKKTPDDPVGAWIRGLLFGTDRKSEGFLDEFKKKIPGKREELPLREGKDLRPQ